MERPAPRFLDRSSPPGLATLMLLAGAAALALNLFLPSMPAMAADLGVPYAVIQLAVPVYFAVNAALQVLIGPIADRWGRRPVLIAAFAIFALASLGCALAPSAGVFLAFRAVQAIVVAGMVLSRAVVRDIYGPDRAAAMIGYLTMGMAVVPMLGPALGGLIEESLGWRANFLLLAAAGALACALAWADLGETAPAGGMGFAEQIRAWPELFRSRRFWGYALTAALASGAFFAFVGGGAFVGDHVYGLTPAQIGLGMGAPSVGYFFGNWATGRFTQRVGLDRMMLAGTLIAAGGLALAALARLIGLHHPLAFFGFMVFVGLGNGMTLPNATAGMLSVRPRLAGTASGIGGALTIGGGAVLSALAGGMLGPGSSEAPLLAIMLASALGSAATAGWVIAVARRRGPLGLR